MRHRIYFQNNEPVEVTCYRFDVQPGAMRVRAWPEEQKTWSVDLGFTEPIHSICDDHGRLVWPTAEAVVGKRRRRVVPSNREQALEAALRKIIQSTHSHVDGRDLLAELHPRKQLDIKRRIDGRETWFEADWLTTLWEAVKEARQALGTAGVAPSEGARQAGDPYSAEEKARAWDILCHHRRQLLDSTGVWR